jgi:hypothetical protein
VFSPRVESLMAKAKEYDRKSYFANYADLRRTYMDLAEQARAMARQLKAIERTDHLGLRRYRNRWGPEPK